MWAKWAWVTGGYLFLGPIYILCGLSGHGLELGTMFGSHIYFVWAKWAGVRTGYLCLGPMYGLHGQSGHGLELGNFRRSHK